MAKRTKKNDPQQKNKKGFDSAVMNLNFPMSLAVQIQIKFIKIKQRRKKHLKMPVNIKAVYDFFLFNKKSAGN